MIAAVAERSRICVVLGGLLALGAGEVVSAQSATLDTTDVDLFYRLYEQTSGSPSADQLQTLYIDAGSPGLRTFFDARRTTAPRLAMAIASSPAIYEEARRCAAILPRVKKRVDAALAKLVDLYPQARLPTVTVAIGRGRPVAIASPIDGVQVGLEALCATDFIDPDIENRFVGVLVHEYVHAQQNPLLTEKDAPTVLEAALLEGGAEFITSLLIGRPAYLYLDPLVQGREQDIEAAFAAEMHSADLSNWFYNSTPEKPGDIGYWVGSRIAKAYYEKATDKTAALHDILTASDAPAFLAASGWVR
ncbi:DUF2268 domain-containing protein [Luteimonas sp. S4-F44]|uniref:DUF2268 domain-containing putative Zn-dependent protease n=1 Tax=Luteimonas sp. S4-F44 TaxID=2925842 RepID=UPI001F532A83|nr:DUF2268 domain-containing putative Zn-dependent protease [Luteimonas sp. S4-F44]UNK41056.1 DUF2268 domain-containing protein [Luteimonas sp. S4-F44]